MVPRKPDERITKAKELYLQGKKLVEIASQLNLPEGTVRRWKSTHKWNSERSDKQSERSDRRKGGQPGNKNAVGHGGTGPPGNSNAEKFGFFRKYLPEETFSIIQEMPKDPLDILWEQIQISYAAIIRAQKIMYVKDKDDKTKSKVEKKRGNVSGEKWEIQYAWDKQGSFLQAQARAQSELRSLIKQYDEMLHKNWDMATEEQKARIEQIRANTARLSRDASPDDEEGVEIINDAPEEAGENLGHSDSEVPTDIQQPKY